MTRVRDWLVGLAMAGDVRGWPTAAAWWAVERVTRRIDAKRGRA